MKSMLVYGGKYCSCRKCLRDININITTFLFLLATPFTGIFLSVMNAMRTQNAASNKETTRHFNEFFPGYLNDSGSFVSEIRHCFLIFSFLNCQHQCKVLKQKIIDVDTPLTSTGIARSISTGEQ